MPPKQLGLTSQSRSIGFAELVKVAAAINKQIARDLAPIWNLSGVVTALPDPAAIPPGVWPVFIQDDIGFSGAAGLHLTEHQQPYALVDAGPTWSLTASHECVEMLIDPSGNWLISSAAVTVENGDVVDLAEQKFEYLVEAADPSEDQANAYMVDEVLVSDFYTPRFYDPLASAGARYSFSGKIERPRQVLPGGYLSWWNPMLGTMQQLRWRDQPEIVDIPGHPATDGRGTLRGFIDSKTVGRPNLSNLVGHEAARRDGRSTWLSVAAAHRGANYPLASGAGRRRRERLPSPDAALRVLKDNAALLTEAGGTKAYVGWRFVDGWITRERAIVVWARPAETEAVRNRLPTRLGGVAVEVRRDPRPELPPLPGGELRFHPMAEGQVRGEYALPALDGETFLREAAPDPEVAAVEAGQAGKPPVLYVPPVGVDLGAFTADMTLTLHISPEQGWAQLEPFLAGAAARLTVGMYELTAPHIDKALSALPNPEGLTLTLDSPAEPPGKREQTVEKSEQDLRTGLGPRLDFAWALSGLGTESVGIAFQTSYHIKVVVKDSAAIWLSSGNFNTSNQPVLDTNDTAALTQAVLDHDRDWHVICECPRLAQTFEAFLQADFDLASNAPGAAVAAAATPAPDIPLEALAASTLRPRKFFQPHVIQRPVKVQPLLTPDNYRKPILDLMTNATTRFYMQTQYIKVAGKSDPADPSGTTHTDLLKGLTDMIGRGLDVRLITSEFQDKATLEALLSAGVDIVDQLRIQTGVHNKGMVVDTAIAVVSSQNWSGLGTWKNRDAGLIMFDPEAAQYFEEIFLHDWNNLARQAARP